MWTNCLIKSFLFQLSQQSHALFINHDNLFLLKLCLFQVLNFIGTRSTETSVEAYKQEPSSNTPRRRRCLLVGCLGFPGYLNLFRGIRRSRRGRWWQGPIGARSCLRLAGSGRSIAEVNDSDRLGLRSQTAAHWEAWHGGHHSYQSIPRVLPLLLLCLPLAKTSVTDYVILKSWYTKKGLLFHVFYGYKFILHSM